MTGTARQGAGAGAEAPRGRQDWPDLARGACMVLVVLLHTDCALWHIGETDDVLHILNNLLVPLRQPLFFLVSGMLGAGILGRGGRGVLVHRIGRYLYLYVLWWLLARGIHTRLLDPHGPAGMEEFFLTPSGIGELFRTARDDSWFFYALAVFFGLALLLSRLPDRWHAVLALLVALPGLPACGEAWGLPVVDWFWYYPFFAFGARRAGLLWALAPRLGRWPAVILVPLAWIVATRVAIHFDPLLLSVPLVAALALLAVPSGLAAAVWASAQGGRVGAALIHVGRNTLPIYVLHPLVLHVLFIAVQRPAPVPKAAWVALVAAAAVLGSLGIGRILRRIPGLFGLPTMPRLPVVARRSISPAGDPI